MLAEGLAERQWMWDHLGMQCGRARSLVCILMLAGCGPAVTLDGTEGSSSSGSGDGPGSATMVATTVATAATTATTSPPPTSTTFADDGTDEVDDGISWDCGAAPPGHLPRCTVATDMGGGGGDESVCDPQPVSDVVAWVMVDGGALPVDAGTDPYDYVCTIADGVESADLLTLVLACADGEHTLEIGTSVDLVFDAGGDFVLSVIYSQDTWRSSDQLVTLRRTGGELVLAGASSPWPPDLAGSVPTDFFDPLEVTLLPDVCEIEAPWEEGSEFIAPCYTLQRQALRFSLAGRAVDVFDHGVDELSPYALVVENAEYHHDIVCTDTGDRWYSWVAGPPIPD